MKKSHFRYWELALLLALAVTILWGAASLGQQEELGRKVIRLHVIANSDSPEDQALKLRVRDRVLARAQEILEQSADMEQAEQALTAALPEIIARSLRIKAQVVEQDPTERGLRRVLNFGHTLGHAIESCAGGELLHGQCVALGMVPMCAPPLRPRLTAILQRCGLPTECGCTAGQLLPYLLHDKKAASGSVTAVLVDEPGTFRMETMTPEEILRRWEERNA